MYIRLPFLSTSGLSLIENELRRFCRYAKVGGVLALNVQVEDFCTSKEQRFTTNFETFSVHFNVANPEKPYVHKQDLNWSGLYLGMDYVRNLLWTEGVLIENAYQHNSLVKPGNTWLICRKTSRGLQIPESLDN